MWEGTYERMRLALIDAADSPIDARRIPASAAGVRDAIKRNVQALPAAGVRVEVLGSKSHKRVRVELADSAPQAPECPVCGGMIESPGNGRPKRFCSDACRKKAEYFRRKSA